MVNFDYNLLIRNLPSYPGILGRSKYFNSVVLVPFLEEKGELFLVLEKRAQGIKQEGEISFPGGAFDPVQDKLIRDTAIRETQEELGIPVEKIKIDKRFHTIIHPNNTCIDVFIGRLLLDSRREIILNEKEVEKIVLVPVDFFRSQKPDLYRIEMEFRSYHLNRKGKKETLFPAQKLGVPRKYWDKWGLYEHKVFVYKYKDETIWGLTAEIIKELVELIV